MAVAHQVRPWSREEYDRMVEAGILGPEDPVELIDGEVLSMAPQSSPHATAVQLVADALRAAFGAGWLVRVQSPLALGEDSEPEPDVAVIRGAARDFRTAHPTTAALVVEVADSSLEFDRGRKQRLYSAAGVPEYWILDLRSGALEVFRGPGADGYRSRRSVGPDGSVAALALPGAEIHVADVMP